MEDSSTNVSAAANCAVCQSMIAAGESTAACPACGAPYHPECWEYNGGCGVYGCHAAPATDKRGSLEVPAGYWGQENKPCPVCQQEILAAALRCRHCGAMFESAQPEDGSSYRARSRQTDRLPALRRASIGLFVLGILPCTAPLAAIIGGVWFARNRSDIAALPAMHGAMCRLGLGVAAGQTLLLIVASILFAALSA
jgi:predicted amidophosphoribosyltransferase